MPKTPKLIPPDTSQCQVEKPNGNTFMTFGGVPGMVRCKNKPVFIVRETTPAKDGLCGAMSMCADCFVVFTEQVGMEGKELEKIP